MFLQRLPSNARSILATSKDGLDDLALMADKIIEIASPSANVYNVDSVPNPLNERLSRLEKHISELTSSIHELRSHSRPRSHT
ncbi:unnamed protein product, partial [Nesidiocoris tenuis]